MSLAGKARARPDQVAKVIDTARQQGPSEPPTRRLSLDSMP